MIRAPFILWVIFAIMKCALGAPQPGAHPLGAKQPGANVEPPARPCLCTSGNDNQTRYGGVECRCTGDDFMEIPNDLSAEMERLIIEDAGIHSIRSDSLQPYSQTLRDLTMLNLENFHRFEPGVFDNLNILDTIYIHRTPKLTRIDHGVLNVRLPKLNSLRIIHTGLRAIPNLSGLETTNSVFPSIDLENNNIQRVSRRELNIRAYQVLLNFNDIKAVEEEAFYGSQIGKLSLKGNSYLTDLHPRAFAGLDSLRHIDLSSTAITILPVEGLGEIEELKLQDTTSLKVFPSIYNFKNIQVAWLTYPYHCCAFRFPRTHDPWEYDRHEQFLKTMHDVCAHNASIRQVLEIQDHRSTPGIRNLLQWLPLNSSLRAKHEMNGVWHNDDEYFGVTVNPNVPVHVLCGKISKNYGEVKCHPEPDAFNPCEDLMGNWALRIPVWFISLSAIVGNLLVILVIVTSHFRLTVSKFLMVNLAIADLCIGLHLFLIAIIDSCSMGFYFNYAIYWQRGDGCKVAGFFTIFGNILSVYTLAVITTERWYTITWAIHLNKRLKLRTAVRVMLSGWMCAVFMASLPLVGVSDYSKTSICLPLEMKNKVDVTYLSTLLAFNAIAFALICVCYGSMYKSIREGNQCTTVTSVRSDLTVAKRMALLVFTDFACWAPIAFFGLTAILGYPLITVTQTKILLVFFYPLNSCANPCLYALLTQQYRRDFFILMGRYGLCKDRAERHKGAIGGVPLPYGSGPQYKRPSSGTEPYSVKQGTYQGNNEHRGSVLTTVVSVEMPVFKQTSRPNSRPNSMKAVQELSVKSAQSNLDLVETENPKYLSSGTL